DPALSLSLDFPVILAGVLDQIHLAVGKTIHLHLDDAEPLVPDRLLPTGVLFRPGEGRAGHAGPAVLGRPAGAFVPVLAPAAGLDDEQAPSPLGGGVAEEVDRHLAPVAPRDLGPRWRRAESSLVFRVDLPLDPLAPPIELVPPGHRIRLRAFSHEREER